MLLGFHWDIGIGEGKSLKRSLLMGKKELLTHLFTQVHFTLESVHFLPGLQCIDVTMMDPVWNT